MNSRRSRNERGPTGREREPSHTAHRAIERCERHATDTRVAGFRRTPDQPLPALRSSAARAATGPLAAQRDLHTGGCVLPRTLGVQRLWYDALAAHDFAGLLTAR